MDATIKAIFHIIFSYYVYTNYFRNYVRGAIHVTDNLIFV